VIETTDEPVALEIAYAMSFFDFDACGDAEAAHIFRQLILEKVKSCPYSSAAKVAFYSNITNNMEYLLSSILKAKDNGTLDQLKGPPAIEEEKIYPHGGPKSCKAYRAMPFYVERRERLMRYKRGEIGVDEALDESGCPSGPASL
jgi:hypothetical protein